MTFFLGYVLVVFMAITPATAEPTNRPEADGAGVPEGIAQFLVVLRWIISYGRNLAEAVRRRDPAADLGGFVCRYGNIGLDQVLARIKRGLMLALALEDKLVQRAKTGRDIVPSPVHYSTRGTQHSDRPRNRKAVRHTDIIDLPLDRLPTAAQIAAELRRRPLGAVLVDICRDLGIVPGNLATAQWLQLLTTLTRYGGNAATLLFKDAKRRMQPLLAAVWGKPQPAQPDSVAIGDAAACPTGPPPLAEAA